MDENHHHHQHHHQFNHQRTTRPSRLGLRTTVGGSGGGEIVEVHGGHIVRSTGRKDRHSKVCTAKGPRDRRVRLAAHTAIQFYDVQDRLGFDRPSKAVDWLIKKAQSAIDELAELPPWKPTGGSSPIVDIEQNPNDETLSYHRLSQLEEHQDDDIVGNHMGDVQNSSFLPASIDSIKSFFPSSPMNNNGSSGAQFHHSFSSRNEDLKLSLQSFQGDNNIYYDGSGWPETGPENGGFSGFMFNSPAIPTTAFLQPLIGKPTNGQLLNYISQRGPLQSSNTPPVRAGVEPLQFTGAVVDPHQTLAFHHPVPGFTSGVGGLSGFDVPARIRGDEVEQDGLSDKPSSASSDSRH